MGEPEEGDALAWGAGGGEGEREARASEATPPPATSRFVAFQHHEEQRRPLDL
jgi:hypothetical protein